MQELIKDLRAFYSSRTAVYLNVAFAAIYYLLIEYIIASSNYGNSFFVTIPQYLIYALVLSASALMALSIYVTYSLHSLGKGTNGIFGMAAAVVGGAIAGCGCSAPLIAAPLYALSLNALEVSSVISWVADYQVYLILAAILINIVLFAMNLPNVRKCIPKASKKTRHNTRN